MEPVLSKVLILGHAPLPWEDLTKSYGPGTRTWQFARPLIGDGHEVKVLASRVPFVYSEEDERTDVKTEHGCEVHRVTQVEFEVGGYTDRLMTEFDPDCVVGATAYPSYVAATYSGERPLWADVFGSLLAEAQAKAAVYHDDNFIGHFLRMLNHIMLMADRFSTVSDRQAWELVGHLGANARLTTDTFGYDFACSIPCGVAERVFPEPEWPGGLGPDDFIVLWSGGFNTWTDVETLFAGLELAMERAGNIHFVSTGAEIAGHDEKTYERFEEMVAGSRFADRFHLMGWVKRSEALSYYGAASVGINLDAAHYEVAFGSRNRILEWALAGLPSVSTDLCELTGEMASAGLLFTVPVADPPGLARRLVELERDRELLRSVAAKLKPFVLEQYSFEKTTVALREWVARPTHAPDFDFRRLHKLEALRIAREIFTPEITPDSSAMEKLSFYLKNEGPATAAKRAASSLKRKLNHSKGSGFES